MRRLRGQCCYHVLYTTCAVIRQRGFLSILFALSGDAIEARMREEDQPPATIGEERCGQYVAAVVYVLQNDADADECRPRKKEPFQPAAVR